MKYSEETTRFACAGDTLLGILAKPETPAKQGVIVIVGGPQYRIGSHRQFVLLSRALAAAGYAVLRFDYRGMGDSEGEQRDFQRVNADIASAIDLMEKHVPSINQLTLWGLCDGASAALLYCFETHDPRVRGLCLLNPWVRSEASLARTRVKHYYTQRLMQKAFWVKLLHGGVALKSLTGMMRLIRVAISGMGAPEGIASEPGRSTSSPQSFQQRMAAAWNDFSGDILLLLSGDDFTAKEFLDYALNDPAWKNSFKHRHLIRHDLPGVDHTFSSAASRALVTKLTLLGLAYGQPAGTVQCNPSENVTDRNQAVLDVGGSILGLR